MLVTNQTSNDYWFGPLHLPAGIGQQLTVDDTSETSLYLTDDAVADAINNLYAAGKITVTSAADPFPRPTGTPTLIHGDGVPEGLVYAPQGSLYMRRDGTQTNGGILYFKTTGITLNTGWIDLATASGAEAAIPTGTLTAFAGTAAPSGWLLCDGSAINRSTYATLFGIIGTTYGSGDGTTTFNLPDLRGRVAVGLSSGGASLVNALGNNDGRAANIRNVSHHHTYSRPAANNIIQSGANLAVTDGTGNTSGDANNTDYPAYLVVNYIIKT
jgi:microcystin-dependent protein